MEETCRGGVDSRGMYLEAMAIRFLVRLVEIRLFRFRIVRLVLPNEFQV